MKLIDNLITGHMDTSIRLIVDSGLLSRFPSVLVTSIDSETNISKSEVGRRILSAYPTCTFLGSGIILPGNLVSLIGASNDLFNGFDELWCYEKSPVKPKPSELWIVSPLTLEERTYPPSLLSWMNETDCKLALGDGIGLNFATPEKEIADAIRNLKAVTE